LATAAVPDGPDVVARWHRLGREQAERLGVEPVILAVESRLDANDPATAALVNGAGLIYLSGGHPAFLADTLRDTLLWRAIVQEWHRGAALAGCSAGAMALTTWVPSLRHPREGGTEGLGVLTQVRVIPHFDAFAARMPDILTRFLLPTDDEVMVLGVDEDTALVGGPNEWQVQGRSSVWHITDKGRVEYPAGATITTP
jgi:cyanophycinase-like exopeptidase